MARILSMIAFVLLLLPVWLFRKVTGTSRFERRFHRAASAWDLPYVPKPAAAAAGAAAPAAPLAPSSQPN
jgi:FPC/CPF motif-containing protein YcgG